MSTMSGNDLRYGQHHQASLWVRIKREMYNNWQLYLLVVPGVVYLLLFSYWPMLGVQIAFKDYKPTKGIWLSPWAVQRGSVNLLKHFQRFLNAKYSMRVIGNTIILSLYTLIAKFPCSILLALMMNELRSIRYRKCMQFVTYAPHFVSTIVVVGIIQQIFASPDALMKTGGIVNTVLTAMGLPTVKFLTSESAFRHLYVWSSVWSSAGWGSIIYMAALSGVDPQQYEAATLDGASKLQKVWYITIPVLIPTAVTLFILDVGHMMNLGFEKAYALQNDSNRTTGEILSTYVYEQGIRDGNYSFSTAVSLFNSMINLVLICLVNMISKKVSEISLW